MRITWWLYPGIHETERMRIDRGSTPVPREEPAPQAEITPECELEATEDLNPGYLATTP